MTAFGYTLSSEEHGPRELIANARLAEAAGFEFAMISDHFHPWVDAQGQSPFVWSVLGALAASTERIRFGTGVTCPTLRIHPAIVAHAAATVAAMMPGRFFLGVGTGENLNEHVLGDAWPPPAERLDMLEEAVEIIRQLWQGGVQSHRGAYFVVDRARLYTLPDETPPILFAASGKKATELAGRAGDGLIGLTPSREFIQRYEAAGGADKPRYAQVHVCYGRDEAAARKMAREIWAFSALPGNLFVELPTPALFEEACELVDEQKIGESVVCGPDPERHVAEIRRYIDAGFDHVYVHQIGPDQEGCIRFYEREVLPRLR